MKKQKMNNLLSNYTKRKGKVKKKRKLGEE